MKEITNLDTQEKLYFDAKTPKEAMEKLVYYLSLHYGYDKLSVCITKSGLHLYVDCNGETYSIANN